MDIFDYEKIVNSFRKKSTKKKIAIDSLLFRKQIENIKAMVLKMSLNTPTS